MAQKSPDRFILPVNNGSSVLPNFSEDRVWLQRRVGGGKGPSIRVAPPSDPFLIISLCLKEEKDLSGTDAAEL